eukprot:TRINITY_DN90174_c0_g1_i3.p1 TRINITY_DN90174_c0_g1~~TRINITY_DN90174_c0_g1_i3.p1  ORF type:complete len:261 (+),score=24.39 TRINITY_DN90174_c0_g1_i3:51-833(+)
MISSTSCQLRVNIVHQPTYVSGAKHHISCRSYSYKSEEQSRRGLLEQAVLIATSLTVQCTEFATKAESAQAVQVGNYLPDGSLEGFSLFVPDAKKTPALRAGTVDQQNPYRFELPKTWQEGKVANIQSGNYCHPRLIFGSQDEGRVQILVSPLRKLTNKANAKIEDIGTPEGLLNSLGSFITGTYLDEEDIVSISQKQNEDGRTYYYYELNAPYGTVGPHTLTCASTKGDLALLAIISANDKQWAKSQGKLKNMIDTFRV